MTDAKTALAALGGSVADGATNMPNIPAVPASDNAALTNILSSMKLWMEKATGSGFTGFATKAELVEAGVMQAGIDATGAVGVKPVVKNMATPPVPSGLSASGAMTNIILTWDDPLKSYANHAYTEVWSAETNSFTDASLIGQGAGFVFSHAVGEDAARYYWIRFVSTSNVLGPFNAVGGTSGQTAKNPAYLMDVLTEQYGTGSVSPFFQLDAPLEINGVMVPAGTYMKSAFIHDASITNAMIGSLSADKITAGTLDAARIGTNSITAVQIDGTSLEVVDGTFSGSLLAASGTFTGELSGATGTFSGRLTAGTLDPGVFAGQVYTYTTPGSYLITVPTGTVWSSVSMRLTLQGAGGGGGGAFVATSAGAAAGGGGGAGSLLVVTLNNMTPGAAFTLDVGAGGAGGASGGRGGNGGATTIAGYSANGGVGGGGAYVVNTYEIKAGAGGSIGGKAGTAAYNGDNKSAAGGAGGSSAYGSGGVTTTTNRGAGKSGGTGAGGSGGECLRIYSGEANRYDGGKGGNGYAFIEFFDPNSVVTNTRYSNLVTWLDSIGHGAVPTNAR